MIPLLVPKTLDTRIHAFHLYVFLHASSITHICERISTHIRSQMCVRVDGVVAKLRAAQYAVEINTTQINKTHIYDAAPSLEDSRCVVACVIFRRAASLPQRRDCVRARIKMHEIFCNCCVHALACAHDTLQLQSATCDATRASERPTARCAGIIIYAVLAVTFCV